MNLTMKTINGEWTVTDADLQSAKWVEIDSGNSTTYSGDGFDHTIVAAPQSDETWWDGIEASDIPANDAEGKPCRISISLDVCDNEDSHIFVNATEEVRFAESEDGERYHASQLAEIVGHNIGGKMHLDYEGAADKFIADHPDARYIMDNQRGFANEWTLYVCKTDEEVAVIASRFEDTSEYDSESVRPWLISAMQSDDDYKSDHGAEKCCAVKWAEDIDA